MRGTQTASHFLCPCCMLSLMFPPLVSPFCLVEINHYVQSKFQTTYLTLFRLLRHHKSELLITASRRTDISRQGFGEIHDGNGSAHVETNRSNPAWGWLNQGSGSSHTKDLPWATAQTTALLLWQSISNVVLSIVYLLGVTWLRHLCPWILLSSQHSPEKTLKQLLGQVRPAFLTFALALLLVLRNQRVRC